MWKKISKIICFGKYITSSRMNFHLTTHYVVHPLICSGRLEIHIVFLKLDFDVGILTLNLILSRRFSFRFFLVFWSNCRRGGGSIRQGALIREDRLIQMYSLEGHLLDKSCIFEKRRALHHFRYIVQWSL